jgi:hypothetical protein
MTITSFMTHAVALWGGVVIGFGLCAILAIGSRFDDEADGAASALEADRQWDNRASGASRARY